MEITIKFNPRRFPLLIRFHYIAFQHKISINGMQRRKQTQSVLLREHFFVSPLFIKSIKQSALRQILRFILQINQPKSRKLVTTQSTMVDAKGASIKSLCISQYRPALERFSI